MPQDRRERRSGHTPFAIPGQNTLTERIASPGHACRVGREGGDGRRRPPGLPGLRRMIEQGRLVEPCAGRILLSTANPHEETDSMQSKISRNAPCPCGSGKKYKLCCMPQDESEAPAFQITGPRPVAYYRSSQEFCQVILRSEIGIQEAFFIVDLATERALYVSPTWGEIWGRPMTRTRRCACAAGLDLR